MGDTFSANEYGVVDGQRGNVGVTATGVDSNGYVHEPRVIGRIPLGDVVPGLSLSPDGSRLYVATELLPTSQTIAVAGKNNPVLAKSDCAQKKNTPPKSDGLISVVDTKRAVSSDAKGAVLARVASGCSPVRIAESSDASALFVSARGDNLVLEFDPAKLTTDPEHAFRRAITTGGTAPVGLRLFDHDRQLAVANSNRFDDAPGTLALIDLRTANAYPAILAAGQFPRNLSSSPDGEVLYLTSYASRSVQAISLRPSVAQ